MKEYNEKDKIIGKIILEAILTNRSPLLLGSGSDDTVDKEIIRQPNGKPYIPASSVSGKIRRIFSLNKNAFLTDSYEQFWGTENSNAQKTYQSHIIFDDLLLRGEQFSTAIRDGVRIGYEKNIAEDKTKYNYEILEPNHQFNFRAEITIRHTFEAEEFKTLANYLIQILQNDFNIGANSTSGFGELACSDAQMLYFEFPKDFEAWMNYLKGNKPNAYKLEGIRKVELKTPSIFSINARLKVKSTFLTSSYSLDGDSDKTQLSRGKGESKEFVVGGKSVRGAIRHRGLKILNTVGITDAEKRIKNLFGEVDEKTKFAQKSKISINEGVFVGGNTEKQTRIKIDRFTGGTIEGALLEVEPLVGGEVNLNFQINDYTSQDVALIMYIMKDLWTGDLAVGGEKNVGRGVLEGISAEIKWEEATLKLNDKGVEGALPEKFKNLTIN